jgi:hypothetical protein
MKNKLAPWLELYFTIIQGKGLGLLMVVVDASGYRIYKEEFYGIPQSMTFHKLAGIDVPLNRFCAG